MAVFIVVTGRTEVLGGRRQDAADFDMGQPVGVRDAERGSQQ